MSVAAWCRRGRPVRKAQRRPGHTGVSNDVVTVTASRLAPVQELFNPRHFVPPVGQEALSQAATKRAEVAAFTALVRDRMTRAEAAMTAASAKVEQTIGLKPSLAASMTIGPAGAMSGLDLAHLTDRPGGDVLVDHSGIVR